MFANFAGQTILARSPSSNKLVLAFMDTLENDKGDGYRVYLFDGNDSWTALPPIAPLSPNKNNFILHLTAIDPGAGPILLYWYDVDTVTGKASIRARLITSDISYTSDFAIAESFGVLSPKWYGDYHTAGGYAVSRLSTSHFYPVWVQPDGRVHFTHVLYTTLTKPGRLPEPQMVGPVQLIKGFLVRPEDTTTERQTIDVSRLITIDTHEDAIREDTRVPPQ